MFVVVWYVLCVVDVVIVDVADWLRVVEWCSLVVGDWLMVIGWWSMHAGG